MYHYKVCAGTPDGLDFVMDLDHEKEFTKEEFDIIVEEAFVFGFEKAFEIDKVAFKSSIDYDHIWEFLKMKGFVEPCNITASYYFEPYWSCSDVKSEKLLQWLNRKDAEDKPEYMI